jgi:Tuberculosis necrotizing toxin
MRIRKRNLAAALAATTMAALTSALPASASVTAPQAAGGAAVIRAAAASHARPAATVLPPMDSCSAGYFDGNKLLGPAQLPTDGPVGSELAGYRRTGGMSVRSFLATYYDSASGSWIYPPDNGFVTGPGGQPEEAELNLYAGQDVDRFGSVYGSFLGPAALPYSARSIPPQNLDGTPAAGCNYSDYEVLQAFAVEAGPITPWFAQPGGGTQFQLVGSLVPGAPAQLNVQWLFSNGYLAPVKPQS